MKTQPINRMLHREYGFYKKVRNAGFLLAGTNYGIAAANALEHNAFLTIFMGYATIFTLRFSESAINKMLELKPGYKEILNRAKNINKIRKLNTTA